MPSIEDWINNPLGIIQTIFDKNGNSDSTAVSQYFEEKLKGRNAITWIPSLNDVDLHMLKPNSLVRVRCMVQDMYDPEFYLGMYEVKDNSTNVTQMRSGKYKDVAECGLNQTMNLDSPHNVTMDRMTLYCVPVPGESEWVKKAHSDLSKVKTRCYPSTSKPPARCKRNLDDDAMEIQEGKVSRSQVQGQQLSQGQSQQSGSREADVSMETENCAELKRQQTEKSDTVTACVPDLNFPLPDETGPACLVKVYDEIDSFKVNDIVEFVGVLSVDPSLARFQPDNDNQEIGGVTGESEEELHAHAPPPSLVPRLHSVVCRRLKHVNPHIPPMNTEDYNTVLEACQADVKSVREHLLSVLEHSLLGDRLTAEYILCHLIASVYGRADAMPLGKFCVNVCGCPGSTVYADLLHHLLSNLVTQSHVIHMSLDTMNKQPFAPHKDYKANRLCAGLLQLAGQTNLVIDEMALQPGQLDVTGVKNMASLGNMISWQKVEYDFQYHRQDFHCNISPLVLSEGKSILPSDALVPLQCKVDGTNLRDHFTLLDPQLTEDFLVKCRTYLGLARNMEYTLHDDVQKIIQDDFVEMRKADPKSMTVDDFHSLLSLTRLLALSELKSCPSIETWRRAKTLEALRKQRVAQLPSRSQAP